MKERLFQNPPAPKGNSRPPVMDIPMGRYEITDIDGFDLKVDVDHSDPPGYRLEVTAENGEKYMVKRGYHKSDILRRIREQLGIR